MLAARRADVLFDVYAMGCALRLAAHGQVAPGSPRVGCLVVDVNGEPVGEGFYVEANVRHAETIALEMSGEKTRGSTVYVTLEPHAHYSRTAPCTVALIDAGVRRVVAAMLDPNPLVAGRGIKMLRENGVQTEVGLLEPYALAINREYIAKMTAQWLKR